MATVRIPAHGDERFKRWAKVLSEVKTDAANGFGFIGQFLLVGRLADLPEGAVVVVYAEKGSRKHREPWVKLYRVENGELVEQAEVLSEEWAFALRDKARQLLQNAKPVPQELRDAVAELVSKYGTAAVEQALREAQLK